MNKPLAIGDKVLYDGVWVEVWTISLDDGTQLSNLKWVDSSDLKRIEHGRWEYVPSQALQEDGR